MLNSAGDRNINVTVGGLGQDTLNGGKNGDILIGGTYKYSSDLDAVSALMAIWTGAQSYDQRLSDLRNGGTDGLFAFNASTILDDGAVDYLFGNQGQDWFWIFGGDQTDGRGNGTTT